MDDLDELREIYPQAYQEKVEKLYRYYPYNENELWKLEHLLKDAKLFHPTPDMLNDPFECKPHFNPGSNEMLKKGLVRIYRKHENISRPVARKKADILLKDREQLVERLRASFVKAYSKPRICSFTRSRENLLLWSLYSDSHRGFCVEFDAQGLPISGAHKLKYSDEYPSMTFLDGDSAFSLAPILTKSKVWEQEDEYRTYFLPDADDQPDNDGESLLLRGSTIKAIYFGVNMNKDHEYKIMEMINDGPFTPDFYKAGISRDSFSIYFEAVGVK